MAIAAVLKKHDMATFLKSKELEGKKEPSSSSQNQKKECSSSLSPNSRRVFSSFSDNYEVFENHLSKMSNINCRNEGKTGDTPLMFYLGEKSFARLMNYLK